jgi:chromosome segregation ATPase
MSLKRTSATSVSVTKKTTENTTATKQASASVEALAKAEKELQKAQVIVGASTDGLTKKQIELREKINSTAGILQKLNSTGNTSGSLFTSLTSKLTLLTTEFQNEAKAVTTATVKQQSMRSEIKQSREEIARMLATGKLTTAQIYEMSKSAGNLKDAFGDASGAINVLSSDTFALDATIQTVQSLASGFQVLQGVSALVGTENEDLQKTLVKLNAVMAITQGLQQIQNALQKNSAQSLGLMTLAQSTYTAVVGTSTGALKVFKIALASTGVGLLVILLASLVSNWKSLTSTIDSNNKYLVNFRNNIAGIN